MNLTICRSRRAQPRQSTLDRRRDPDVGVTVRTHHSDRHHAAGRPFEGLGRLWRVIEAGAEVETSSLKSGKPAIVDEQNT